VKKVCGCLLWLMIPHLWGQGQPQEQAPAPAAQAQAPQDGASAHTANRAINNSKSTNPKGTSNDRLFYTLPNFLTVENAANVAPLTPWEKFKLTAQDSFDPVEFLWYGAQAGIAQAENKEPSYGQGASGYGQRYAERFGDGTIQNFMTHPVFGSILHQDPRYFRLGKGGFWRRTSYAVSRVLITRSDSGTTQFNYSEVLGAGTAAGLSTYTYHPRNDRNLSDVLSVWGSQVGYDALGYVMKEFWPDIKRKLHK
jgi:hypothetical protein